MKIGELLERRGQESRWKKDFINYAILAGQTFNSAEKLARRAEHLRDLGISAETAWKTYSRPA